MALMLCVLNETFDESKPTFCHTDIMSHLGIYAQAYDNSRKGTILSGGISPYTTSKKKILG